MKPLFALAALACSACVIAQPVPTHEQTEQVRKAIEEADARFCEATRKGDTAAMAATYTDDAQLLAIPGAVGPAQIRALFDGMLKATHLKDLALETLEVEVRGETAWETGTAKFTFVIDGKDVRQQRRYLVIWKRGADGAWKMHRDLDGESVPL